MELVVLVGLVYKQVCTFTATVDTLVPPESILFTGNYRIERTVETRDRSVGRAYAVRRTPRAAIDRVSGTLDRVDCL